MGELSEQRGSRWWYLKLDSDPPFPRPRFQEVKRRAKGGVPTLNRAVLQPGPGGGEGVKAVGTVVGGASVA